MDGVSAGASVVTFVVVALQSAKAVHDVLSAVKDGPQNVQILTDSLRQLQNVLERITQLHIRQSDDADSADLECLAQKCAIDVAGFQSKLRRLTFSADERRVGRLWKRLRVAVNEKDLDHCPRPHYDVQCAPHFIPDNTNVSIDDAVIRYTRSPQAA